MVIGILALSSSAAVAICPHNAANSFEGSDVGHCQSAPLQTSRSQSGLHMARRAGRRRSTPSTNSTIKHGTLVCLLWLRRSLSACGCGSGISSGKHSRTRHPVRQGISRQLGGHSVSGERHGLLANLVRSLSGDPSLSLQTRQQWSYDTAEQTLPLSTDTLHARYEEMDRQVRRALERLALAQHGT